MGNFRTLLIWQKAMVLVTQIYNVTKSFPKEEVLGLTPQIRRCAVSIPSNIAEGYGRQSNPEFIRFVNIASGSLFELQTQIEIALNIGLLHEADFKNLYDSTRELEIMIVSFQKRLKDNL